jgi:predicted component of type VI protein secretion system
MSFIRNGEIRTYFDGESNAYVYPSGGTHRHGTEPSEQLQQEGARICGQFTTMKEADLAEIALRMIERTDVSDEAFEEVVQEMVEYYPRTWERSPTPRVMADTLQEEYHVEVKQDALFWLEETFPQAGDTKIEMAFEIWEEEYGSESN